jgi:Trypsin-like peptidase domain
MTVPIKSPISVLKPLWTRDSDGQWGIHALKSLGLSTNPATGQKYFLLDGDVQLMSTSPSKNIHEVLASFGSASFLMKQSIVPVVSWKAGDEQIRCVGTATIISCSGYVLTAAHVLMDPWESRHGGHRNGNSLKYDEDLEFGVLIPTSPAYGVKGFRFFPFEKFWLWGSWKDSPLLHERSAFTYSTDIAICKIPEIPNAAAHQPFSLSIKPFAVGESAYAIGYAEMDDIPIKFDGGQLSVSRFEWNLYVSIGSIMTVFHNNHIEKAVPTPGPCFDFNAKIPGKMSGAPVFGAQGAIIRGVVSRSFSGEEHAYGAMLGPAMDLPLDEPEIVGRTLRALIGSGREGFAQVFGAGL